MIEPRSVTEEICHLPLEAHDRVLQGRAGLGIHKEGIVAIGTRPEVAVLADAEMARPGRSMGVERDEERPRRGSFGSGTNSPQMRESRVGFIDLVVMFPIGEMREGGLRLLQGSLNLEMGR